jgi:hypothetical protein
VADDISLAGKTSLATPLVEVCNRSAAIDAHAAVLRILSEAVMAHPIGKDSTLEEGREFLAYVEESLVAVSAPIRRGQPEIRVEDLFRQLTASASSKGSNALG